MDVFDAVVIGAGQAGLSSSFHLTKRGIHHVVLDANRRPGGAWQHRWDELTMSDVHGIADLPGQPVPNAVAMARANQFVPDYFGAYEQHADLPVIRPVKVRSVRDVDGLLHIEADDHQRLSRTIVSATGTWSHPFVPYYRGAETFAGEQLHTVDYAGPDLLRGRRVLVVGGGTSAIQFLGAIRPVTETVWVTRHPPQWRAGRFTTEVGRDVVAEIDQRVRRGLPPGSIASATGLSLRAQEREAERLGAYERRTMFDRIEPHGVRWADGSFEQVDVILWATGFRPAIDHLRPLRLRSPLGGIQLDGTTAVADRRVQLVGYGPSASTIGANRAGRVAARGVAHQLASLPERSVAS